MLNRVGGGFGQFRTAITGRSSRAASDPGKMDATCPFGAHAEQEQIGAGEYLAGRGRSGQPLGVPAGRVLRFGKLGIGGGHGMQLLVRDTDRFEQRLPGRQLIAARIGGQHEPLIAPPHLHRRPIDRPCLAEPGERGYVGQDGCGDAPAVGSWPRRSRFMAPPPWCQSLGEGGRNSPREPVRISPDEHLGIRPAASEGSDLAAAARARRGHRPTISLP
jgi:hypothetical protein